MTSETAKQRRKSYSLSTDWLAYVCLSGNGFFAVAVLALHLLQPERSPLNEPVSFYVHGAQGWLFTAGLLAWGGWVGGPAPGSYAKHPHSGRRRRIIGARFVVRRCSHKRIV